MGTVSNVTTPTTNQARAVTITVAARAYAFPGRQAGLHWISI
jgi:hypothetical protein